MERSEEYIDILINSCTSAIHQMTRYKVKGSDCRLILKDKGRFKFAHIISYKDQNQSDDGEFILGFDSSKDALTLASAISDRLGIGRFDKICEDSTDLLNEFLNIVVGRTISEWDKKGLSVKFNAPVFKTDYVNQTAKPSRGYIIILNITSDVVDLAMDSPAEQVFLRVNFIEQTKDKMQGKKILLVEDSKVMRTIISKMLKAHGAVVQEAGDGEEGIRVHKAFNPDLTLMDINMPKLDGFETISRIRTFNSSAKFIILSSSSRKDEILSAKTLNVSGYLVKPVEEEKLIERVAAAL